MKRSTPEESAWLTLEEPLDEDPLEEELLDEEERLEAFLAEEEVRVFIVTLPTVPSCASPLRFWKALTASSVS